MTDTHTTRPISSAGRLHHCLRAARGLADALRPFPARRPSERPPLLWTPDPGCGAPVCLRSAFVS